MRMRAILLATATLLMSLGAGLANGQTNLALGKSMSASSSASGFGVPNANDGNVATYWEGAANTYPNTLTVSLGANNAVTRVVVKLNASWGTRTQTIQVLGHNLSTTTFTSLVGATSYSFAPASANTVTIPLTATVSDVRLTFTANSGAVAGQAAELEVYGGTATPTATSAPRATATATPPAGATATATARAAATPTLPAASAGPDSGTLVHLFEWTWPDVAVECETYLGPKGYKAVQVSPPNEHVSDAHWWARYQPVSYRIESYGGTRAQFSNMVSRCKAVGVDVYADVIFNHTASLNGGGTGSAGSPWSLKSMPMYSSPDYHNLTCSIDYNNASTVQNCDLVGLPDLNTGSTYVRQTEANFANDLLSLGVNGFRVDAAKHVSNTDLSNIYSRFSRSSYIYQEVIDNGGEAVHATDYTGIGNVENFQYSIGIGSNFKGGQIRNLRTFASGFFASNRAIAFVDNHDNQRGHSIPASPVTFKDGSLYDLANVFMLAWPYGYPRVMSSYNFTDTEAGPPGVAVHQGSTLNCFGSTWVCEHRWRGIANMVAFRRAASGSAVANWWDNGLNQIAFSRAGRGFVVINRQSTSLTQTFTTGLPAGTYCNIIDGDFASGTCSGPTVIVNSSGQATLTVPAMHAAAIHVNARL